MCYTNVNYWKSRDIKNVLKVKKREKCPKRLNRAEIVKACQIDPIATRALVLE